MCVHVFSFVHAIDSLCACVRRSSWKAKPGKTVVKAEPPKGSKASASAPSAADKA